MSLAALALETYLAQLASESGTPGGGAAAAFSGAQAAALLAMTARISGSTNQRLIADLDVRRANCAALADHDGEAFGAVMTAMKLPRGSEAEKAARAASLETALHAATEVPLRLIAELESILDSAAAVIATAKASVVSDAGIAVELAAAAIKASRFNVEINLQYLKDETFKTTTATRMDAVLARLKEQRKVLIKAARQALRTKSR